MNARRIGIVCDFDGTITMQDTAWTMLNVFDPPGWRQWNEAYHAGQITDQQAVIRQFALMTIPIAELTAWALEQARIRPGAHEFFAWCSEHHVEVTVASNGLDFYISPLLERAGLAGPEVVCGRATQREGGIAVTYEHLWDTAYPEERDQKRLAVRRLRDRGLRVVYIGDGSPDFPGAALADVVFARYKLADRCGAKGVPFRPFEDFFDILAALSSEEFARV